MSQDTISLAFLASGLLAVFLVLAPIVSKKFKKNSSEIPSPAWSEKEFRLFNQYIDLKFLGFGLVLVGLAIYWMFWD